MAGTALTNTYAVDTAGANNAQVPGWTQGVREDLDDVMTRIDPDETPIYNMCAKGTKSNIQFDWQVQELKDLDTDNAKVEGFQFEAKALKKPDRWHNVMQIMAEEWSVTDTMEAVDAAGRSSEMAYQKILKALEIRRNLDGTLAKDQLRVLTPEPRKFSSWGAWISNMSVGATGSPPTGDGSDIKGDGTPRNLTLELIDDALEMAYDDGGNPSVMTMRPNIRRQFSKLPGVNTNQTNISATGNQAAVTIGTVAIYLSDFGKQDVVMDRWMPNERIYLFDKRFMNVVTLPGRSFKDTPVAKGGSSTEGIIEWEGSLQPHAPKAHAAVVDLNPTYVEP